MNICIYAKCKSVKNAIAITKCKTYNDDNKKSPFKLAGLKGRRMDSLQTASYELS